MGGFQEVFSVGGPKKLNGVADAAASDDGGAEAAAAAEPLPGLLTAVAAEGMGTRPAADAEPFSLRSGSKPMSKASDSALTGCAPIRSPSS